MSTILGLILIVVSIYFLGQEISFVTYFPSSWWQKTSATGSVLALIAGISSLTFWRREMGALWLDFYRDRHYSGLCQ